MLESIPFSVRVAVLLVLMVCVAGVDRVRHGTKATKYKEYLFILVSGVTGCLVGCFNDLFTSWLSPEYFILGKGLSEGPDLRVAAGLYGMKTGFSAGIIGGAICLFSVGRKEAPAQLYRLLWMPVATALLAAAVCGLGLSGFDPAGFSMRLSGPLDSEAMARFRRVWWIHTGLYAGLIIGLAAMILRARRFVSGNK